MSDIDIDRLSTMMRKYATAASMNFGTDCWIHSALPQAILARLGISSRLVIGDAAWRVGNGDGDVIAHSPLVGAPAQQDGAAYHAWLEIDGKILDLTTYQLRAKAFQLDNLDGGTTTVDWCPAYLYVDKEESSSFMDVMNLGTGLFHYARRQETESLVTSLAPRLDQADVEQAWLIYNKPEIFIIGPSTMANQTLYGGVNP